MIKYLQDFNNPNENIKTHRRTETALILLRFRLSDSSLITSHQDLIEFEDKYAACLQDCPANFPSHAENLKTASSPVTALMQNPEPYVGDAYLLVIVQYYMNLYHQSENNDKAILLKCCAYLEQLLDGVFKKRIFLFPT